MNIVCESFRSNENELFVLHRPEKTTQKDTTRINANQRKAEAGKFPF